MGGGQVGLGDVEIVVDHIERGVTEQALKGEDVTAAAQVPDGEGVAEAVGVDVGNAGAFFDTAQHESDGDFGHREEKVGWAGGAFFFHAGDVEPQGASGCIAQYDQPGFGFLAGAVGGDEYFTGLEVDVFDLDAEEFANAQACIEQGEYERFIALTGGDALAVGLAVALDEVVFGVFEYCSYVFFGEGDDVGAAVFWSWQAQVGAWSVKNVMRPREE